MGVGGGCTLLFAGEGSEGGVETTGGHKLV